MTIDWAVVFATIAGPILAVWASEIRQRRRALQDRREWVFRTLWATRSAPLNAGHVEAINNMDLAFPEKDYPEIADAWHQYSAQLNTAHDQTMDGRRRWQEKANSLLSTLIHLMAKELNIAFPKSLVEQPSYYPDGWANTEAMQNEMRALLLQVLKGERAIPIKPLPQDAPP